MSWQTAKNMARADAEMGYLESNAVWSAYDQQMKEYRREMAQYEDYERLDEWQLGLVSKIDNLPKYLETKYEEIIMTAGDMGSTLKMPAKLDNFNDFDPGLRQTYVIELINISKRAGNEAYRHGWLKLQLSKHVAWVGAEVDPTKLYIALEIAADYASYCGDNLDGTVIQSFLDTFHNLERSEAEEYREDQANEIYHYHAKEEARLKGIHLRLLALAYYLEDIDRPQKPTEPEEPCIPRRSAP